MSTNRATITDDIVEIQQLLAKYAVTITQGDIEGLVSVFTPDGTYSAFGETYVLERFPVLGRTSKRYEREHERHRAGEQRKHLGQGRR